MADRQKAEELREQFFKETGYTWENSQGEPDIDYVYWLENKVIYAQQVEAVTDEEIIKYAIKRRKEHLRGKGNMSTQRVILGEIKWLEIVIEVSNWLRSRIKNQ
jgi:hypothetical protein